MAVAIDPATIARFAADLDALLRPDERVGLAVSGGPDSLALLLLAAAARPGRVAVASVDHSLRAGSRREAEAVAELCRSLDVPHAIVTLDWPDVPTTAIQEKARAARYAALAQWARTQALTAIATGHHADDQAETVLMRLARGSGLRGLAAMRPAAPLPGASDLALLRPLLAWRRGELRAIVAAAGIAACDDPSNDDERHERVRVRRFLADNPWLDPAALATSAAHLAAADDAVEFAVDAAWDSVRHDGEALGFVPGTAPPEIRRRIVARAIAALASEGDGEQLRGSELDRLLAQVEGGGSASLRGVLVRGGGEWRFAPAPARR
jgi:tRNA(Ile)-lysidine synthase